MPELSPLLPYALAALLGAWCAWLTWFLFRIRRRQLDAVTEQAYLRKRADDTWRVLNGFVSDNGYSDNYTKTRMFEMPKEQR